MSTINPDDIAQITLLKGASAAALYGAVAANGAIMITKGHLVALTDILLKQYGQSFVVGAGSSFVNSAINKIILFRMSILLLRNNIILLFFIQTFS